MQKTETFDLNEETFRRVWQRVMPRDRPDCPFTLEPDPPIETQESPQTAPVAGPPEAPPKGGLPRRGMSGICLGEESLGELPVLTRFLALTLSLEQAYRALGPGGLPARLARAKTGQARRLATACFLLTGKRPERPETLGTKGLSGASGLRACYRAEQGLARELLLTGSGDPCLASLYRELAGEDQRAAGQIRTYLEKNMLYPGLTDGSARYGSARGG